jgi:hypothetical protein
VISISSFLKKRVTYSWITDRWSWGHASVIALPSEEPGLTREEKWPCHWCDSPPSDSTTIDSTDQTHRKRKRRQRWAQAAGLLPKAACLRPTCPHPPDDSRPPPDSLLRPALLLRRTPLFRRARRPLPPVRKLDGISFLFINGIDRIEAQKQIRPIHKHGSISLVRQGNPSPHFSVVLITGW